MDRSKDSRAEAKRRRLSGKTFFLKVGALFGSLLFTLIVCEIICRILRPTSDVAIATSVTTESGRSEIRLIPSASGLLMGEQVSINANGYRGALRLREKPPGVVRVSIFGDSHTFGVGADDDGSYPAQLEKILLERTESLYEVLNFGVGGHDFQSITNRARLLAFDYDSDVVLMTFHQGDLLESGDIVIHSRSGEQDARPAEGDDFARPGVLYRIKTGLVLHSAMAQLLLPRVLGIVRGLGIVPRGVTAAEIDEVRDLGPVWRSAVASLEELNEACRIRGCQLAVICFPSMIEFERHPASELHSRIESQLESLGIPVLDLVDAFKGQNVRSLQANIFDGHPNAIGYGIAAESVADFVMELASEAEDSADEPVMKTTSDSSTAE